MPDRLPSLILLVGFWIPPAVAGYAVAEFVRRSKNGITVPARNAVVGAVALAWSSFWFLFQIHRMPPYIPGSTMDPTYAPPQSIMWLALIAVALVLPGSLIACLVAFRRTINA